MAPAAAEVAPEAPPAGGASTARTTRRRQVSPSILDGDKLRPRRHNECNLDQGALISSLISSLIAIAVHGADLSACCCAGRQRGGGHSTEICCIRARAQEALICVAGARQHWQHGAAAFWPVTDLAAETSHQFSSS